MNALRIAAAAAFLMGAQSYAGNVVASGTPLTKTTGASPGGTVAHTKVTGMETHCPTTVLVAYKGNNYYKSSDKVGTGAWPRVSTFVLTEPGQYLVRNLATESAKLSEAEKLACGFHYSYGTSGIPGDNAVIEVSAVVM